MFFRNEATTNSQVMACLASYRQQLGLQNMNKWKTPLLQI